MTDTEGDRRDDRGRTENSAGAWAAAAVVLALGGLGFGVVAQVRASDLEQRVAGLERLAAEAGIDTSALPTMAAATTTSKPAEVDPGVQPADPGAAEAAVRNAFVVFYDGSRPEGERLAVVDDPRGVAQALRAAAGGEFALQVANSKGSVSDVAFDSPTSATARFSVLVSGQALVADVEGAARLVDGAWKVTRSTVCASLDDVGSPCPP